ncbi:MAG: sigma-54-dependent Fis family transcriptional regulator [Planctomycetes bacterium]|nr:sigma-54-dependent Fis family transcriptional regulator [Planctomycetota bacterium]
MERILVVEDERLVRWSLEQRLREEGYEVALAEDARGVEPVLEQESVDLVLLDMRLPDADGLSVMRRVLERQPAAMVIIMTAYSTVETAVEAMRLGAYDYIHKPFDMDEMVLTVRKALETTRLRREVQRLRDDQRRRFGVEGMVGATPRMLQVFDLVERIAQSDATTVLVQGESGTGKDLVAKAIHFRSARSERPFMNITCTALTETLLESELFGHEKGAFTDAREQKKGLFELADGGTVFLDEIGDMPMALQSRLLRVLEDKSFKRVGGTRDLRVDVRIVAATNRELEKLVADGRFRKDLYYRLQVIPIYLPPLRERREDVIQLAEHFIDGFNREFRKRVRGLTDEARDSLLEHDWPGNIRELRNMVERAMILGRGEVLEVGDLFLNGPRGGLVREGPAFVLPREGLDLEQLEKDFLVQALTYTRGNQTRAASLLGMNRDQVRYRLEKFGMSVDAFHDEG